MEAKRVGGGGIALPITIDRSELPEQLRQAAQQIHASMASIKAEAKVKAGVDYDETAIQKMAARDASALRRVANRQAYLDTARENGMLPALVVARELHLRRQDHRMRVAIAADRAAAEAAKRGRMN